MKSQEDEQCLATTRSASTHNQVKPDSDASDPAWCQLLADSASVTPIQTGELLSDAWRQERTPLTGELLSDAWRQERTRLQISPTALAYLGDAVYELYVRSRYLLPPKRIESYHHLVVAQVRAETQALQLLKLTPHLNETELEIVRRGRNAATRRPKRVKPQIYQQATSLEALMGYLYLTDKQRLTELLEKLDFDLQLKE